ncbi:hypothetical protein ACI3L1_06635 [Deinococcus sp. SM5_A1]|uniref:hypothetical protein n=1 Tax=Deinococcus sp. SM5_A1 TaxID=3379094 RepID=UPI00385C9181
MSVTIEDQARAILSPVLGECIRQRTAAGVAKYGQTLDDNHQPRRAKIVHLVQELLDGVQYALWVGYPDIADRLASEADALADLFGLTAEEIMEGGKQ